MATCRRANGEGAIRKRTDGRWELRMVIDDKRVSYYADTKTELMKKKKEVQTMIDGDINMDMTKMTMAEWMDIWLKEYCVSIKPLTLYKYTAETENHIKPALGDIRLCDLRAPIIQNLYKKLLENGMSPKSIKNIHGVIHKALDQAVKLGYVLRNETEVCILPRAPRNEMHPLKDGALEDFLNAIKGTQFEKLYQFATFTGMRQGEVLGLTWDCVNFKAGRIRIRRQLQIVRTYGQKSVYALTTLKNGKERMIVPAQFVMDILQAVKAEQEENQKRYGEFWNNEMNLVFTNECGGHLTSVTVLKHLKDIVTELGYPEVRFHDLRHTFATVSLENGDNVKTVSDMLGHATTAFTMDVYGHVSDQMQRDSAKRMDNFISNLAI